MTWRAVLLLVGCGGGAASSPAMPIGNVPGAARAGGCTYATPWARLELRTPAGWTFAHAEQAQATTTVAAPDGVVIDVATDQAGWRLRGRVDPDVSGLATPTALPLAPTVAVLAHGRPAIVDTRDGALRVGLPAATFSAREGWAFVEPPAAWVDCATLTPSDGAAPDPEAAAAALGLGEAGTSWQLRTGRSVAWRATPDGAPFATVAVGDANLEAATLETRGDAVHLIIVDDDVALHGWVAARDLEHRADFGYGEGGGGVGEVIRARCTLAADTPIEARDPGRGEVAPIGTLAAGTVYRQLHVDEAGAELIKPDDVALWPPRDVEWWIKPAVASTCAQP